MTPRLLSKLGGAGLAIRRVVPLESVHALAAVLELEGGARVVVRSFKTSQAARYVWNCLRHAPPGVLPRPLVMVTRHIVTEFVEGAAVVAGGVAIVTGGGGGASCDQTDAGVIRAVGLLLAKLHGAEPPVDYVKPIAEYKRLISRMAGRLARRGYIDQQIAGDLSGLPSPADCHAVITHGDPAPRNFVVPCGAGAGALVAIDIERLALRPAAFDLARVVCLWPLNAEQENALIADYTAAGASANDYVQHRTFWIANALATSASYRMVYQVQEVPPIAAALTELVTNAGR